MKTVFHFGNYKKQCTNGRAERRRGDVVERNLISIFFFQKKLFFFSDFSRCWIFMALEHSRCPSALFAHC